jgi:hypothetical protein
VDDIARGRRLLLTLAAASAGPLLGGCGGRDAGIVGISPPRAAERLPRGAAEVMSPVPSDFRAHLARLSDRFLSGGHGDGFDAIIWANDAARAASDAGGFAEGAMFVEELMGRSGIDAGATQGLLVMEKRADGWRFVAVGPDGTAVGEPRVQPCADCHREAPHDFVFVAPETATYSSSSAATPATTAAAPRTVAIPAATYDVRSAGSADAPSRR